MLRLEPETVGGALLDRVFEVITESQLLNPYWRPVKPIVATPQGNVLFPLSVETAGSLLRCCSIIDKTFSDFNSFTKNIDLFRRFSEWLRARSVSGLAVKNNDEKFKFFGWHSEHVHLHPGIHIWETSNVLLFFQYYTAMLEKHIAKCSLDSANLHEDYINRKEEHRGSKYDSPLSYWDRENGIVEPLQDVNNYGLQPYKYAKTHIIGPRSKSASSQGSDEKHYSVLLYGPPGTGKTTFAEEICRALEWPLITVTPSDFIHGGESEVESRAKRIFEVLEDQIDAIILLDEIDRMILDRSSIGYTKQGDIFQFMTPSMLTKLRNLRKKERVIFIIATNYKERIDSAAIRKGRVDEHLLMSPANGAGRIKIIQQIISKKTKHVENSYVFNKIKCKKTALKCSLSTYGEIESLVNEAIVKFGEKDPKDQTGFQSYLEEKAAKRIGSQSITLMSYRSRFNRSESSEDKPQYDGRPFTEFFTLLYIKLEDNIDLVEQEKKLIINAYLDLLDIDSLQAWEEIRKEEKKTRVKKRLAERCPELGTIIIDKLSSNISKLT
jgi:SpoVK/Ycf46/Vps4 family AAA+-type ATPase